MIPSKLIPDSLNR